MPLISVSYSPIPYDGELQGIEEKWSSGLEIYPTDRAAGTERTQYLNSRTNLLRQADSRMF